MKKLLTILLLIASTAGYSQLKTIVVQGGGGSADTTGLSNRINTKLNISDSTLMLLPYRTKIDLQTDSITSIHNQIVGLSSTAATNTSNIALKLNKTDTAAMLAGYQTAIGLKLNKTDTAAMLSGYQTAIALKLNKTDTTSMLSGYQTAIGLKLNKTDTTSMLAGYQTAIGLKLNKTDTAAMLAGYQTAINAKQLAATATKIVVVNNTSIGNTGSTTENTIFTGTIPANSIGVNGSFHIDVLYNRNNTANGITARIKFNGTTIVTQALPVSASSVSSYTVIRNRNSLTAQVSGVATSSGANVTFNSGSGAAVTAYTFNTAATITVTVTLQNAVSTDTPSMEGFTVTAFP